MDRQLLLERVADLRNQGQSIRAIAAELGIHPSRVQRALKRLDRNRLTESVGTSVNLSILPGPNPGSLVGRQREIDQLKAALDDAMGGQGRIEVLAGEPGIGKTRTAKELAFHAQSLGAQVLWGWCYQEEGVPLYWPWVDPIRSFIQQCDSQQLWADMGPGAADIAEIIPEIRNKLPNLEVPQPLDSPEAARFRLFNSISSFLLNRSRTSPLVIILDDLHWADRPSLLLLHFLSRRIAGSRILVVGCYRDQEVSLQHPLIDTLALLAREPLFHRQALQGISQHDTARYIELETGRALTPGAVATIHSLTAGNPFFLTEVVRLLAERGELGQEVNSITEGARIPAGVREAVGQRLNRRSEHCNRLLSIASVIGREFSFNLLSNLMEDVPEDARLEALEEGLSAGMIEAVPESAGSYRFTHFLVQSTLLGELSDARKARLHARIGDALEQLCRGNLDSHVDNLAYHFAEALPVVGPEKLIHYSLLAGELALDAHAPEEALVHFERALIAKGGSPVDDQTAAILLRLGRAQAAVLPRQRRAEALDSLRRAFDYYIQVKDLDSAAEVAQFPLTTTIGTLAGASDLISQVLPLVDPASMAAGRLQVRNGWVLGRTRGDYDSANRAFDQALSVAQRHRDSELEMDALASSAEIDVFHLRCQEGVRKCLRAIEIAQRVDDPRAEVQARQRATLALTIIGDLEGARLQAEAGLVPAHRLRDRFWWSSAFWSNQFVCRLCGDWAKSRDYCDQGLEIHSTDTRILADRVLLEYNLGNFHQGDKFLQRIQEGLRQFTPTPTTGYAIPAVLLPLIARINSAVDASPLTQAIYDSLRSELSASPILVTMAAAGLALVAVSQNDKDLALAQYAALEPQQGTMVQTGAVSVDRILGLLAHTVGKPDQAREHFEGALALCRRAGYRCELVWTRYDYASVLLQQHDPSDRRKARTLLDEAQSTAQELGLRPLLDLVAALQEKAGSRSSRGPAYPAGLTHREVEVLGLIAQGKSNPEISEDLFISLNTVTRHLTNIFAKINVSNRAEAAVYAAQHDLL